MKLHVVLLVALAGVAAASAQTGSARFLAKVDHLVFATPDLDTGIRTIEQLIGVRATPGGQHPGLGTRNALVSLGPSTYLEIIGPDPDQSAPKGPRRFGIDRLKGPTLVGWVAKATDLDRLVDTARERGVTLGAVMPGSRKRPDGVELTWRYTDPAVVIEHRLIPYFIDWGSSPHPALSAAPGGKLVALRAEHPDPARVSTKLKQLGLDLPVAPGPKAALIATLEGPSGRVQLRGAE
jgi:Glyoxalase-like domain